MRAVQALALAAALGGTARHSDEAVREAAGLRPDECVPDFEPQPYVLQGCPRASYRRPGCRRNARVRRRRHGLARGGLTRDDGWFWRAVRRMSVALQEYQRLVWAGPPVKRRNFLLTGITEPGLKGRGFDQVIVDDVAPPPSFEKVPGRDAWMGQF